MKQFFFFLLLCLLLVACDGRRHDGSGRFWYNTKSGVLHNSSCKHYGNSYHGYYTDEPHGKNCNYCGGSGYKHELPDHEDPNAEERGSQNY